MTDEKPVFTLRKIRPSEIPLSGMRVGRYKGIYDEVGRLKKNETLEIFFTDGKAHTAVQYRIPVMAKRKYQFNVKVEERYNKLYVTRE